MDNLDLTVDPALVEDRSAPGSRLVSHGEIADTADTTKDSSAPEPEQRVVSAEAQVMMLENYLLTRWPGEMGRTNRQMAETPVEVAIRLLDGLSAMVPPSLQPRCDEQYCNRPKGHTDAHGWVNYQR